MIKYDIVQGLRSFFAPRCSSSAGIVAGRLALGSATRRGCIPGTGGVGLNVPDLRSYNTGRWNGPSSIAIHRVGKDRLLSCAPKSHRHHNPFDFYPDDKPPNMEEAVFGTDEFMHQQ